MSVYKPSQLHAFLTGLGVAPKKVLSQNFLIDGNIVRKILRTANVQKGDVVLEIGPGPGALTEALLETGAHVMAVEKDQMLAKALERLQTEDQRLQIFCEDIMEFSFSKLPCAPIKVIANLPYHLTSPIVEKLVQMRSLFSSLTLMVQEEVARRFTARPRTKDYSSFTLFLQFYSRPTYAFSVSNRCFFPAPRVHSAVVLLTLQEPPSLSDPEAFFILTRTAFQQRRKMLRSSLKDLYPPDQLLPALAQLGCSPKTRPEELSLPQFLALFAILQSQGIKNE